MLPSLCRAMAVNQAVSRFSGPLTCGWQPKQRFALGFRRGSWQHRCRDCGTLMLSGRCGNGFQPRRQRAAASCQAGGVASSAVAGRSRRWQAPAR